MPTLIQNHRKHVVETKLAKVYSVMNQAVRMSVAENGDVESWIKDCGNFHTPTCSTDDVKKWFNEYIGKYLNTLQVKDEENGEGILVYFNDGGILYIERCIYDMLYYIDEKALGQARRGVNTFSFRFSPVIFQHYNEEQKKIVKQTFEPYTYEWNGTYEDLFENPIYGCAKSGHFCTKLIQYNGWKIPKDYPIKF